MDNRDVRLSESEFSRIASKVEMLHDSDSDRLLSHCRALEARVSQLTADVRGARDSREKVAANLKTARSERDSARAELERVRADMEDAAGELVVPLPEAGTDMAKLLSANVLLRAERDRFRMEAINERRAYAAASARAETDRCHVCGRRRAAISWMTSDRDGGGRIRWFGPGCVQPDDTDCKAHAIDWRARAEKAEADRDEARRFHSVLHDAASGGCLHTLLRHEHGCALNAINARRVELERVRAIVVRVADAVGAKVSPQSSVDFMEDVPREVSLVLERVRAERDEALEKSANTNAAANAVFRGADALRADRDEWRTQHDNAVACWYEERDRLTVQRNAATARAEKAEAERARLVATLREAETWLEDPSAYYGTGAGKDFERRLAALLRELGEDGEEVGRG